MKQKKPTYDNDMPDLKSRRQRRLRRERRIKWLLTLITIAVIALIAVIFRKIAQRQFGGGFKAPLENPTYWYEQTREVLFLTTTPTPTSTFTATVPTPTPTPTLTHTPTLSPTPTLTPTPKLRPINADANPADLLAEAESTLAARRSIDEGMQTSEYWFEQIGGIIPMDASIVYPNAACTWMGVAGNLTDKRGEPQIGFFVQLVFDDGSILETLSGLFPGYGDAGYELTLARPVHAFEKPVWIQILDQDRLPASKKVIFRPSSDCAKSLIMINFQRVQ